MEKLKIEYNNNLHRFKRYMEFKQKEEYKQDETRYEDEAYKILMKMDARCGGVLIRQAQ